MATFQDELERSLHRLATGEDDFEASTRRLLTHLPAVPSGSSRRRLVTVAVALGSAAATVSLVVALHGMGVIGGTTRPSIDSSPTRATDIMQRYDGPKVVEPGQPCPGAVNLPNELAAIKKATSVPIWKPQGPITRAWLCGRTPVLMIDNVQISYEADWSGVDIEKKWADLAADTGGTVQTIAAHLALVQPADGAGTRNQVLIVNGDTLIRLLATSDVAIDRLVQLAGTLNLS